MALKEHTGIPARFGSDENADSKLRMFNAGAWEETRRL
jgi:hypothetical protein